jgi:hypothetical protein
MSHCDNPNTPRFSQQIILVYCFYRVFFPIEASGAPIETVLADMDLSRRQLTAHLLAHTSLRAMPNPPPPGLSKCPAGKFA